MIKDYGTFRDIPGATFQPRRDLEYKILFDCREAEEEGGQVAPALDRLARLVNMLEAAGVPAEQMKLAVIFHSATTFIALAAEPFAKHVGGQNPAESLLKQLQEHGVELLVCGQSVLSHGFGLDEVDSKVTVATSSLIVLATYQLDGYALLTY